jgi:hypothetical protein
LSFKGFDGIVPMSPPLFHLYMASLTPHPKKRNVLLPPGCKNLFASLTRNVFSVILFVNISAVGVSACDCKPPSIESAFREATVVFLGHCISGKVVSQGKGRVLQYEFDVVRSWKGVSAKTVMIETGMSEANCSRKYFDLGSVHLVYAHGPVDHLMTTYCDRGEKILPTSQNEIRQLDALVAVPARK